jgi:ribosomal subunit interface protein
MKVDFNFKHVDSSQSLMAYTEERLAKIEKFELKPMDVQVVYSMQKHECIVDVIVLEGRRKFKANSVAPDFYRAVDNMVNKLGRQLSKDKSRVKHHKNIERSHYGQISLLTENLETDFARNPPRKTG